MAYQEVREGMQISEADAVNRRSCEHFYADLERLSTFSQLTHFERYRPLPDDWFIGIADVVNLRRRSKQVATKP